MDPDFNFSQSLQVMQNNLDHGTANLRFYEKRYRRMSRPRWLKAKGNEPIRMQVEQQQEILANGQVIWSTYIQANELLFREGKDDCPAALLYSNDPKASENPELLGLAASEIGSLKGQVTQPEFQYLADRLADEYSSDLKTSVPHGLTGGVECFYTTVLICRKHLLYERLDGNLIPLVCAPNVTDAVTVLPERYWDLGFISNFW